MELKYEPAQINDIGAISSFNREQVDTYENIDNIDYNSILEWVHRETKERIRDYICAMANYGLVIKYHCCI